MHPEEGNHCWTGGAYGGGREGAGRKERQFFAPEGGQEARTPLAALINTLLQARDRLHPNPTPNVPCWSVWSFADLSGRKSPRENRNNAYGEAGNERGRGPNRRSFIE